MLNIDDYGTLSWCDRIDCVNNTLEDAAKEKATIRHDQSSEGERARATGKSPADAAAGES